MEKVRLKYLSSKYFELLKKYPQAGRFFAIAAQVVVVLDGRACRVVEEK